MKELLKYLFSENSLNEVLLFGMLILLVVLFSYTKQYQTAEKIAFLITGGALGYLKKK